MPTKSSWLLRLPEILEELKGMSIPFLDRSVMERLFRVQRRRAIQLMSCMGGGYIIGKTFLIDRVKLIDELETIARGDDFSFERRRKDRLINDLEQTRKEIQGRRIKIQVAPDVHDRVMSDLPAGIHLRPGELRIEFFGTEDLLRHLYELSQAIINDYSRFQAQVEV